MIIYKITNNINKKVYIGQTTKSMQSRYTSHKSRARCKRAYKSALHNAIKKYGESNFSIEEIDGANNLSELNYREDHYINIYDSMYPNGYNLKKGGRNSTHSKYTRRKQSMAMKEKYNKKALDDARLLSIEKIKKEVVFENHKTGEIINFPSVKATAELGSSKYISDILTQRRPYGLYKGYWIYFKNDKDFLKKRIGCSKIELNISIRVKNIVTGDIKYYKSKKQLINTGTISQHMLNKHLDSGIVYNNLIIERDL